MSVEFENSNNIEAYDALGLVEKSIRSLPSTHDRSSYQNPGSDLDSRATLFLAGSVIARRGGLIEVADSYVTDAMAISEHRVNDFCEMSPDTQLEFLVDNVHVPFGDYRLPPAASRLH